MSTSNQAAGGLLENIEEIKKQALTELAQASDLESLDACELKYLGRKGSVTLLLRNLSKLPAAERPAAGRTANQAKAEIEAGVQAHRESLKTREFETALEIDVSLPGRKPPRGTLHPLTHTLRDICEIFVRMGFEIAEGPEVETDYYNFEALNVPKDHPARDMQDTFYISDQLVLRTQTSPMQVRVMEKQKPPIRIIAPGKVYRCDSDLTHTPMFSQVEGLLVDENATFGDLKGILTAFVHRIFDEETSLRFRPSFFPFTEPSAEVDIRCVMCRGRGCRVCSQTGWLEVLGAGMVHPAVFENVGVDTSRYRGFAFGMGVERIAMLKYEIDDLRKFFENDYKFLRRF